ncbi:MAG TPA: general stress protein [Actinotalea sp.]|nr:general stress protein [Actinotalea sp.]
MTMNRSARPPAVPTPPHGEPIAAYATYLEAQGAVDHLSDKEFPVQNVTIVGTDLRMVERVTGRLTYSRVALAGLATGAWFGLFVGLLLSLFAPAEGAGLAIFPAVAIGAAFGILFSVISYAFTGGKRDFTSSSQIVATTYALLCSAELAHKARAILTGDGGPGLGRVPSRAPLAEPAAAPPTQSGAGPDS